LVACVAPALAACGSSSSPPPSVDPASLTPASAPVFAGAHVQPQGALRAAALAAGADLTGQADPYLRLLAALQTPGPPTLGFARDVRPRLGRDAGVFLRSLTRPGSRRAANAGIGDLLTLLQRGLSGESPPSSEFPF